MDIIVKDVKLLGTEQAHKDGDVLWERGDENHKPVVEHIGDWCRKQ